MLGWRRIPQSWRRGTDDQTDPSRFHRLQPVPDAGQHRRPGGRGRDRRGIHRGRRVARSCSSRGFHPPVRADRSGWAEVLLELPFHRAQGDLRAQPFRVAGRWADQVRAVIIGGWHALGRAQPALHRGGRHGCAHDEPPQRTEVSDDDAVRPADRHEIHPGGDQSGPCT